MHARLLGIVLLVIAIHAAHANEGIDNLPEVLRFVRNSEAVYVFPVTDPHKPKRDDAHLRLLPRDARESIASLLGNYDNWWHGLFTIALEEPLPIKIGLLFRIGRDELVLFADSEAVEGTFRGTNIIGMLEDKPKKNFEDWKRHYAQPELDYKSGLTKR